jgi:ribosomal protein S6--L-glutamate ligase
MKKLHFLVLSTGRLSRRLIKAIESRGHTYECYSPKEFYLLVSDSKNGKDRIFVENGEDTPKELFTSKFNAVITRLGGGGEYGFTVLQHLTDNCNLYSPQRAGSIRIASNKMWTTQKVSAAGLLSPTTVFAQNPKNIKFLIEKVGELPCVAKTPYGSQGTGVIKMIEPAQTIDTLELLQNKDIDILLQTYIPAGGKDYRAIVVGDKVVCTMLREAKDGFKANLSQGGSGKKVELSKEHQDFCVKASKAIGLEFSGVDLMISNEDNKAYLVEINSNPGTRSIDICGINWFVNLVEFIESKVNKPAEIEDSKKTSLSLSLEAFDILDKSPEMSLTPVHSLRLTQIVSSFLIRGMEK